MLQRINQGILASSHLFCAGISTEANVATTPATQISALTTETGQETTSTLDITTETTVAGTTTNPTLDITTGTIEAVTETTATLHITTGTTTEDDAGTASSIEITTGTTESNVETPTLEVTTGTFEAGTTIGITDNDCYLKCTVIVFLPYECSHSDNICVLDRLYTFHIPYIAIVGFDSCCNVVSRNI